MGAAFDIAVQRLNDINWNMEIKPNESHSALVAEYLRRLACFFKAHLSKQSPLGSPLDVLTFEDKSFVEEAKNVAEKNTPDIRNPIHYKICKNYLELVYLMEISNPKALNGQQIYEPIIQFFEKGGKLRYDHDKSFSCGSAAFVLNNWVEFHSNRAEIDFGMELGQEPYGTGVVN
ncbi:hypothetical protein [Brevibacillus sp. 179-C9.3 HS]|uniref:hypothetical protein n=1 Tax=unclassified Brevibacillus TaxID=2684853 RepID=UPI0039A36038